MTPLAFLEGAIIASIFWTVGAPVGMQVAFGLIGYAIITLIGVLIDSAV